MSRLGLRFAPDLRSAFFLVVLALGLVTTIVYFNGENANRVDEIIPKNYINMTLGFMRSMDIYKPYDKLIKQKVTKNQWAQIEKKLKAKTKGAFIVYSHCKSDSQREKYTAELRKYFPIDTFGKCGDTPCDKKCLSENIRDYRFYVAFENNICEDYITEKFFRIKDLILPLVMNDLTFRHVYEDIADWFSPKRRCDNTLVPRLLKSQL